MTGVTLDAFRARLGARGPERADSAGRSEAAVAVVLAAATGGGPDLLLIRRAEVDGDPWSGQMALPGGRREDGDRGLLATAIRETREEIGVRLGAEHLLGELDDLAPLTAVLPPIVVRPYVFWLPERPHSAPSAEVAFHLWTPLLRLPEAAASATVQVRGGRMLVPAFCIGDHVVWGMTHRILLNLIALAL